MEEQSIVEIFETKEGNNLSYKSIIKNEFRVSPQILGTILISLADEIVKAVPEKHLAEFDNAFLNFFLVNYKNRFDSQDLEYVPDA
jgi:hypothetical protein